VTIIRVDFSSEIGFGHLKRIENFVKRYKKTPVMIVCKECEQKYTDIPIIEIKEENDFFEIVKKLKPKEVVVDNYNFTYEDEKKFKELFPNIKLICFDDMYKKHYCDEIINPNLCKKTYKNLPSFTKVLYTGPLISEKFKKVKSKREGIFICFGATDVKNVIIKVLKLLKNKKQPIYVYTTSANKNIKLLKRFCKINKNCKLHIDEDVAKGMQKAEVGIISASTLSYEAMKSGMAFIAVRVVDNQNEMMKCLKSKRKKVIDIRNIRKLKWMLQSYLT